MITFCFKPYKTITSDTWLFKRIKTRVGLYPYSWQRITKIVGFVYWEQGQVFNDAQSMFKEASK